MYKALINISIKIFITKNHDKMDYSSTMGVIIKGIQELDAKLKIKEDQSK